MNDEDDEIPLHRIVLYVCQLCLDGAGGECHVPGCAYWMKDAPTGFEIEWLDFYREATP